MRLQIVLEIFHTVLDLIFLRKEQEQPVSLLKHLDEILFTKFEMISFNPIIFKLFVRGGACFGLLFFKVCFQVFFPFLVKIRSKGMTFDTSSLL